MLDRLINGANKAGFAPLHYAAWHGCTATAHLLLTYGANPTRINSKQTDGYLRCSEGSTPLHIAVIKAHYNFTWLLLKYHVSSQRWQVGATATKDDSGFAHV